MGYIYTIFIAFIQLSYQGDFFRINVVDRDFFDLLLLIYQSNAAVSARVGTISWATSGSVSWWSREETNGLLASLSKGLPFSACLRLVISRAIVEAPIIFPVASLTGETVMDTSMRLPSFLLRTVSTCSIRCPSASRCMISSHSCLRSGGTRV